MKIEKFKVLLYLKKSGTDKSGKAPIMGRITVNRTMAQFGCKLSCKPELWNARESRLDGKSREAVETNAKLDKLLLAVNAAFDTLVERGGKAKMQQMQEQHGKQIRNLQGIHNQELEAKDREISRLNSLLEKAHSWFPMFKEMLRMEKLCAVIGFTKDMIESLLTKKEAIQCSGKIYSEEHRRKFDIKNDVFRVEKHPMDSGKLILTINRIQMGEWFKEQFDKLRQSLRRPTEEPRKSRGFKL
ncbi:Arm DNA-binding domain-containing protein [Phocaeicola plebeius]|uniref:Arm DNA-binding domain-containing protein n=1 Tax=Phocaeicola plebeius TaxID=310297 RepID=UPI0021ABEFFB|nr:Arm DNA-binding domain-containing protein [Phocaeicola plebeius]MCR8883594.1 Arm DNA-binding domain-containing protein [Phocaeicola plebeius]MDM8286343.1 Arm DNA-binding domain-containing protein [Phocaeicola plebeius]